MSAGPAAPLVRWRISAARTFVAKFVFPALAVVVFGLGFRNIFAAQQAARIGFSPNELLTFFSVMFVVFGPLFWRFYLPLKVIETDDENLYISNYRREIRVPLQDVENVRQGFWMARQVVTIQLRTDTPFGRRIVFLPTIRGTGFWNALLIGRLFGSSYPVVAELSYAANRAEPLGPASSTDP